ncbi:MAG: hypothetical protein NFW15_10565, partial [Candidatus Accumulibacter sp.]|nr:hypothetical protein [Accumulibacter sp.]MCM8636369.1 hypothetical protein [Accumulibacter sp.]
GLQPRRARHRDGARLALIAPAALQPRQTAVGMTIAAQWEHHNPILGVKNQAIPQFGGDSDEVASPGLKKKSERKTTARRDKVPK